MQTIQPAAALRVRTTLYELIDAINEQVQPGEDGLVAAVVLHLFASGQIKFSCAFEHPCVNSS